MAVFYFTDKGDGKEMKYYQSVNSKQGCHEFHIERTLSAVKLNLFSCDDRM